MQQGLRGAGPHRAAQPLLGRRFDEEAPGPAARAAGSLRPRSRGAGEHVVRLRSAARRAGVPLEPGQLLLHQLCHHQGGVEPLVADDRRLVHLPDLVEHAVRQAASLMLDLDPAIGVLAHYRSLARQGTADRARL